MIGEIIQKNLEKKNLTPEEISQKTGVPLKFIFALIDEDFSSFPPPAYLYGYFKKISHFLKINFEENWQILKKDLELAPPFVDLLPQNRFASSFKFSDFFLKILKFLPLILMIGTILGFLIYQAKVFFAPPTLKIISPALDIQTKEETIKVEGFGPPYSYIKINDREVYLGEEGHFSEIISLQPGLNEIRFEATSRSGKKTLITRQIYRE